MNYKPFFYTPPHCGNLPYKRLQRSTEGTYALVDVSEPYEGMDARAYSIQSQLDAGVNLQEVNRIQPLNRCQGADIAESIYNNIV